MFMRTPAGANGGRRRGLLVVAAVLIGLYLLASTAAGIWTEYLWFSSLGYASVWWSRTWVRAGLLVAGVGISFLFIFVNLTFADRMSLRYLTATGTEQDELLARMREWAEPRLRMLRLLGSGFLALMVGAGAANWIDRFFLFVNSHSFGEADPIFQNDIGFYVFRLPLIADLLVWGFNLMLLTTLAVALAHYLNGSLRPRRGAGMVLTFGAKTQLSLLLAALALLRAGLYRLDAFRLLYSDRADQFFGPGYTEVTARLPALQLLLAIAAATAVALVVNIWRQGWTIPVVAAGAWLLVTIGAAVIYPAIVERFQVVPNPFQRQQSYIAHNIAATRDAYGLDRVEVRVFPAEPVITRDDLDANQQAIANLRLWDPLVLARAYSPQEFREYYTLNKVDPDRYLIDGRLTQVMMSVRELDKTAIENNWQLQTLSYTHGFGAVASSAARIGADGEPSYLLREIPPAANVPELELTQPRIYFGEVPQGDDPVVVRNGVGEIDYPTGQEGFASFNYDGSGGVELSDIWRRLAMALRYRDLNMVISGQILPDSRILMERNVRDIVNRLAPFFAVDSDPYPVIVGGRVVWVLDLYTTSASYPYATPLARTDIRRLPRISGLGAGINYVRNSVKVVIDSYDGSAAFYASDPSDPILAAWRRAFPDLVQDLDRLPAELRGHIRYPQDLFTVQSEMYRAYHVTDPASFFQSLDVWAIPASARATSEGQSFSRAELLWGDVVGTIGSGIVYLEEVLPYYLMMQIDQQLTYVALQSFTPRDRANMSAFLVVDSNPDQYGRMVDFRMPPGATVAGIAQVAARIEGDSDIAAQFTLWRNRGSRVIQGDITVIPVEESLLYVQPVFLEAEGNGLPKFERVIVVYGERIEWGPSLAGVLDLIFADGGGGQEPPPGSDDVAALLEAAQAAFSQAELALRSSDLAGYQRLIDQARNLVEQALEMLGADGQALAPLGIG
jgi:uncharacterized membrane protein (UPF0182 family)